MVQSMKEANSWFFENIKLINAYLNNEKRRRFKYVKSVTKENTLQWILQKHIES